MIIAAAAALAVSLAAGSQTPAGQSAGPDGTTLPVSIERVQEGLQRPPGLKLPNPEEMAYFRATIEEALPLDSVLDAMRRDLAAWRGYPITAPTSRPQPLVVEIELLGLARSFLKWRAERHARHTVQEALNEFCSTHDCSVVEGAAPIEGVLMPRVRPLSSSAPSQ
jgi:hypothetical protein